MARAAARIHRRSAHGHAGAEDRRAGSHPRTLRIGAAWMVPDGPAHRTIRPATGCKALSDGRGTKPGANPAGEPLQRHRQPRPGQPMIGRRRRGLRVRDASGNRAGMRPGRHPTRRLRADRGVFVGIGDRARPLRWSCPIARTRTRRTAPVSLNACAPLPSPRSRFDIGSKPGEWPGWHTRSFDTGQTRPTGRCQSVCRPGVYTARGRLTASRSDLCSL